MAKKIIFEYKAKQKLYEALNIPYSGVSYTTGQKKMPKLSKRQRYVIKVDQGIKKRGKKNLIKINISSSKLIDSINEIASIGYSNFLIEPYIIHPLQNEKYLSLTRTKNGIMCLYSNHGGVDIENNSSNVFQSIIDSNRNKINDEIGFPSSYFNKLLMIFDQLHFSFLEINPLLIINGKPCFLDAAAEVDPNAIIDGKYIWSDSDFVSFSIKRTKQEELVENLSKKSNASFSLTVVNPKGSIGLLLSGGGASLVIADELYQLGLGKKIINYGEYSGNPNKEDTYIYAKNIIALLVSSPAKKKVLLIGGGVANFTDVRITFMGLIRALKEAKDQFKKQKISILVRRGGPHQKEGLEMMKDFLNENGINGKVDGPELMLSEYAKQVIEMV